MTQVSLGIRPVWPVFTVRMRNIGSFIATHWAHSADSDQNGRMPRLIWVCAGRTCHFVGFVMLRLIWNMRHNRIAIFTLKSDLSNFNVSSDTFNHEFCPRIKKLIYGMYLLYNSFQNECTNGYVDDSYEHVSAAKEWPGYKRGRKNNNKQSMRQSNILVMNPLIKANM